MAKFGRLANLKQAASKDVSDRQSPLIRFYQLIPGMRRAERADDTAAGTMPARAYRLCEAMRYASAFGWYLYSPISFKVMWDGGSDMLWTYTGADAWYPVNTAYLPGFPAHFDRSAPSDLRPFVPPFLAAFKEPGLLQIWTGTIARSAPGWSLLVRSPANLAHSKAYDFLEGIIKTDTWFGPLFTTIRITRTNAPIEFSLEHPLLQVQPVHRALCYEHLDRYEVVPDMKSFSLDDWAAFRGTIVQSSKDSRGTPRQNGSSRKRAKGGDIRLSVE